jgi:hypothetical protein
MVKSLVVRNIVRPAFDHLQDALLVRHGLPPYRPRDSMIFQRDLNILLVARSVVQADFAESRFESTYFRNRSTILKKSRALSLVASHPLE